MNKIAKVACAVIVCTALIRGGYVTANMEFQRRAIPAKLATGMFYAEGSCGDILSYQGAYLFDLKSETIAALQSKGAHFFDDIDSPTNRAPHSYFGGRWRPTPMPDTARDGELGNMYCGMARSWRWPGGIPQALQRPGGYYQTMGGRTLIVLPQQGYVVAIASDR